MYGRRIKPLLQRLKQEATKPKGKITLIIAVVVLVIAFQLLMPRDRALPFASLNGEPVGGKSRQQISQQVLDKYSLAPITVRIVGESKEASVTQPAGKIGVIPDISTITRGVESYPLWQRFIPGSIIISGLTKNQPVATRFDRTTFKEFSKQQEKNCLVKPKNAGIRVKEGKVSLDAAENGQHCNPKIVEEAFKELELGNDKVDVKLHAEVLKPQRANEDVKAQLGNAEKYVKRSLSLRLESKTYPVEAATIASWLTIAEDPKDMRKLTLAIDNEKVKTYVADMQKHVYVAPGITTVKTADLTEVERIEGAPGRGLDQTKTAERLQKQLQASDGVVDGILTPVPPKVVFERSYTPNDEGLKAMVTHISQDNPNIHLNLRFANGTSISGNGGKQIHPASTYKMYVAYSVLKRISSGAMKWSDQAEGGKTVSQCFDLMIIQSENSCAEYFGKKIGWKTLNEELKGLGLGGTNLYTAWLSNADDESLFLMKLERENILPKPEQEKLIDTMRRQVFRNGIPAGTGDPVADKVGFLDGMLHDAALVYSPKGVYALTIMSSGSSWGKIAEISKQLNQQIQLIP